MCATQTQTLMHAEYELIFSSLPSKDLQLCTSVLQSSSDMKRINSLLFYFILSDLSISDLYKLYCNSFLSAFSCTHFSSLQTHLVVGSMISVYNPSAGGITLKSPPLLQRLHHYFSVFNVLHP